MTREGERGYEDGRRNGREKTVKRRNGGGITKNMDIVDITDV